MKATFQASVDSVLIGKRLMTLTPGEEITYDDLSAIVPGRDLREKHRYILETGRGIALRESNVVTGCISGKGIRRLTDPEIVELPQSVITHIRRASKRASKKVLCADFGKLNTDDKMKFNASLSVLGTIMQFTSHKSLKAVSDRVTKISAKLPIEETVGLFLKSS